MVTGSTEALGTAVNAVKAAEMSVGDGDGRRS
jgi:hypothetical protein